MLNDRLMPGTRRALQSQVTSTSSLTSVPFSVLKSCLSSLHIFPCHPTDGVVPSTPGFLPLSRRALHCIAAKCSGCRISHCNELSLTSSCAHTWQTSTLWGCRNGLLGTLTPRTEDPGSVPSTPMWFTATCDSLFWPPRAPAMHMVHRHNVGKRTIHIK